MTFQQASPRATPKATPLQSPRTESAPLLPQDSTPNQTTKVSEPPAKAAPSAAGPPAGQTPSPAPVPAPVPAPSSPALPSQVQPAPSETVTVPAPESASTPGTEPVAVFSPTDELTFHQIEQKHQEQMWEAQRQLETSTASPSPVSPPASTETISAEVVDMTASMIAKQRITTEEEAKAALAERRRLAREQAEREAELERQRLVSTIYFLFVFYTFRLILILA